jgi:hypothetical protein
MLRHETGIVTPGPTPGLAVPAEQAADRISHFVDRFADGRFRAGDAVDHFFGDFGDAGIAERPRRPFR